MKRIKSVRSNFNIRSNPYRSIMTMVRVVGSALDGVTTIPVHEVLFHAPSIYSIQIFTLNVRSMSALTGIHCNLMKLTCKLAIQSEWDWPRQCSDLIELAEIPGLGTMGFIVGALNFRERYSVGNCIAFYVRIEPYWLASHNDVQLHSCEMFFFVSNNT